MLFLKNIESVELMVWDEGSAAPVTMYRTRIANASDDLRAKRMAIQKSVAASKSREFSDVYSSCLMEIEISSGSVTTATKWLVCNSLRSSATPR